MSVLSCCCLLERELWPVRVPWVRYRGRYGEWRGVDCSRSTEAVGALPKGQCIDGYSTSPWTVPLRESNVGNMDRSKADLEYTREQKREDGSSLVNVSCQQTFHGKTTFAFCFWSVPEVNLVFVLVHVHCPPPLSPAPFTLRVCVRTRGGIDVGGSRYVHIPT